MPTKEPKITLETEYDEYDCRYIRKDGIRTGYRIRRWFYTYTAEAKRKPEGKRDARFAHYAVEKDGKPAKNAQGHDISGMWDWFGHARIALVQNYSVNELGKTIPAGKCIYHWEEQKGEAA